MTKKDKKHLKFYNKFISVAENVLAETSTKHSPWLIIDGFDIRYSSLTIGQHILSRIEQHLEKRQIKKPSQSEDLVSDKTYYFQQKLLESLDLSLRLDKKNMSYYYLNIKLN